MIPREWREPGKGRKVAFETEFSLKVSGLNANAPP